MTTGQLLSVAITIPATVADDAAVTIAAMAGRLGFAAIHLSVAPALAPGMVRVNDPAEVRASRAEMDAAGKGRPLLVAIPISIGRTMNEAIARADLEPRFAGDRHPRLVGIFGTFEQAQDQVLALARAGADGLVLDVPLEGDVADVLAQIRALVVGATPELVNRQPGASSSVPPRTVFHGR